MSDLRTNKVRLPDPYQCKPGDTFALDYKNAGQIVKTATFTLVAVRDDGELFHRWVQR